MIAVYARQSVDKKDSISIETQIDYCRAEAGGEEIRVYQDKGYSGSNTNRPAFRLLLGDIQKGEIRKVIIYKLDRMSRSLLDFSKLIELFRSYGVEFQSTQEKFDTATPIGNAMLSITMVFAQLERETIQQRIRDNYYSRGQKGMYLGGKPPFGYRKRETLQHGTKTSMLIPEPEEIALVQRIFSMYADGGRTLGEIGRALNRESGGSGISPEASGERGSAAKENAPCFSGKRFCAGNLNRIIRNPVYVRADADVWEYYRRLGCKITNPVDDFAGVNGCFLYGKRPGGGGRASVGYPEQTLSVALHGGCVEPGQWLRAQERLAEPPVFSQPKRTDPGIRDGAADPGGRLGTGGKSWLGGLVVCGFCGSRMSVKTAVNKDRATGEIRARYSYLSCNGRKYGACTGPVPKRGITLSAVEDAVEGQLMRFAETKNTLFYEPPAEQDPELETLKRELAKTEGEIRNLLEAVRDGTPLAAQYLNCALEELDCRKREQAHALTARLKRNGGRERIGVSAVLEGWGGYDVSLKKRIARQFVESAVLFHREEGDELHIRWKVDFLHAPS